jgi:hypothetical protein
VKSKEKGRLKKRKGEGNIQLKSVFGVIERREHYEGMEGT